MPIATGFSKHCRMMAVKLRMSVATIKGLLAMVQTEKEVRSAAAGIS
jgi:hypothetical protein